MIRNATVFEYDPGWMEHMSIGYLSDFYRFVNILREVAGLSGARVKLNVIEPGSEYYTYSLVFVNWTEKSMGDLEAWIRVHPQDDAFLKKRFDMQTIMSELRNLISGKDRFGYDLGVRCPETDKKDEGRCTCASSGVFTGMSVKELAETLGNIHIDPNFGMMPGIEQEVGYMAIGEAIRRLKALNATPEKCRPLRAWRSKEGGTATCTDEDTNE